MSNKYYTCIGDNSCGRLIVGNPPKICPECGGVEFKEGVTNFTHRSRQEYQERLRQINNKQVSRENGLAVAPKRRRNVRVL